MIRALILVTLLISSANAWPMTDPVGDTVSTGDAPTARDSGADLQGLDITETNDALTFILQTSDYVSTPVYMVDSVEYRIQFQFGEENYNLAAGRYTVPGTPGEAQARATFWSTNSESKSPKFTATASEMSITIPRVWILDENGARFSTGRTLENMRVESTQFYIFDLDGDQAYGARDVMPDTGSDSFVGVVGPIQHPDLILSSPAPVRWSNGGASTYAFQVDVNTKLENVEFAIENAPSDWQVHAPTEVVNGSATVILQTPSKHMHDGHQEFLLAATANDVRSEILLGLYYPPIPMPAGHHPELFLHGVAREGPAGVTAFNALFYALGENNENFVYMNTEMPTDFTPVYASHTSSDFMGAYSWGWKIPLSPQLRIGLNLTEGPAPVNLAFASPSTDIQGRFGAELVVGPTPDFWAGDRFHGTVIASFQTDSMALGDALAAAWEPWLVDEVPYEPNQYMGMNLYFAPDDDPVQFRANPSNRPTLTGGSFTLPLGEYGDGVTIPISAQQEEEIEKLNNPTPEAEEAPAVSLAWFLAIGALAVSFQRRLRN